MRIASKIALAVLLCTFMVFANDDLRFADSCYAARAERAKGDKADAHNAKLMIDAYRKAMDDASVAEAATEGHRILCYSRLADAELALLGWRTHRQPTSEHLVAD